VTLHDLTRLLDYHYWARDRMLDAVRPISAEQWSRDLGNSFKSLHHTILHTYSAEWVWYERWQGQSPTTPLNPDHYPDLGSIESAWKTMEGHMRSFLSSLGEAGLAREFHYRLFNGTEGKAVFWQMLQHVINHASYHRGQVTTLLRQLGAAPPKSEDLIAYYRENP
jgi:uncharacterized damage-inducible protein DinB